MKRMLRNKKAQLPKSNKRLGIASIYNDFVGNNPDILISFSDYSKMIRETNEFFKQRIIEDGADLNMSANLSVIGVRQIPRNHERKIIDWGSTNKLECNKKKYTKLVYFTDDFYFRIYWNKSNSKVKNKTVYKFNPTSGKKGFKAQFKDHVREHELAATNYKKFLS